MTFSFSFCDSNCYGVKLTIILVMVMSSLNLGHAADDMLGASFIFGDSLVDAGNNNFLSTLSKADSSPNGIDFKASGGNPTGRFTNGRTIGDIVGKFLHILECMYFSYNGLRPFNKMCTCFRDTHD